MTEGMRSRRRLHTFDVEVSARLRYQGFNESRRSLTRSLSLSLSYTHRMGRGKEEVAMVVPATGRLLERRVAIGVREGEGAGEGGCSLVLVLLVVLN